MIEDLKQVRDALQYCKDWYQGGDCVDEALTTLDRIIADHIPDARKMVVPDGYKLVPIEVVKEIGKLSTILSIEEYKERENYCVDEEDMANTFMDAYDMFVRDVRLLNKKMLSSAPTPAQPEKVIDWAGLDKIRKSATGKTLDQLNAWSYANDTRKAGDNAQPEKLDVEALKREVCEKYACDIEVETAEVRGIIRMLIDHLAYAGYFRAPLPRIEGVEDAVDNLKDAKGKYCQLNEKDVRDLQLVLQAARAYLKASEGV